MLRRSLLTQWTDDGEPHDLQRQLRALDRSDPHGAQGVEARLAIWFAFADPGDGGLVAEDDPVLTGVSDELRHRLAAAIRPGPG